MQEALQRKLQDASSTARRARDEFTIFRVPEHLRSLSPEDYEPKLVSIGPFHRGKDSLRTMETHKLHCLNSFLRRTQRNESLNLNVCVNSMRRLEERARNCYSENFEMTSDQFVEIMLLDGCFIVELLLQKLIDHHDDDYPIVGTQYTEAFVFYDVLLLENQLPFFIIQELFDLIHYSSDIPLVRRLFETLSRRHRLLKRCRMPPADFVPDHILHLFKYSFEVQQVVTNKAFSWLDLIFPESNACYDPSKAPAATRLHACGAKFKIKEGGTFSSVTFCNGVLEMTSLEIEQYSVPLLRNFVALEQCNKEYGSHFTSYAFFMVHLVRSPMDVALLEEKGVLIHYLGFNDDARRLLHKLGEGVCLGREHYLGGVTSEMNKYCHSRRNRWRRDKPHENGKSKLEFAVYLLGAAAGAA